ncbi:hypothetical protein CJF42_06675 [Pseudoalteromonas sp. NBT06-2]|uniref:hypothetical protein n=1 Tax=Pseudoalteromonas sp. NBT06-2 TaxID=2025950 RepID=UPI000BA75310|nr:hypothetical protein [Pseudoalteromonas sp. NBT06-2]PAJ75169.1 hypothetical protein CJF42_06675 [Pseudoalteromonas sp. NBT06-2]
MKTHQFIYLTLATSIVLLTGCSSTTPTSKTVQPISNVAVLDVNAQEKQPEYVQPVTLDENCKHNALALDNAARTSRSTAQYLASARLLSNCISDFSHKMPLQLSQNVMQLHALSIFNYIKGGDVSQAKIAFVQFKSAFPGQDLYFNDYTSLIDTATALLEPSTINEQQMVSLNISTQLRDELKRRQYWLNH